MVNNKQFNKIMAMNTYVPDKKIWVVAAIEHYGNKRDISGNDGFADIPEVKKDIVNVIAGMVRLGANPDDIKVIQNASKV